MDNQPAKKSPIMIIVVVIVIAAIAVGVYFLMRDSESTESTETNTNAVTNTNIATESRYTGNSFSIAPPEGWETGQAEGVLLTMQDTNDTHPAGSAADTINFMTYMTVLSNVVNAQTLDELIEYNKDSVLTTYPETTYSTTSEEKIDGQTAAIVEGELNDSGLDLGILIAVIPKDETYFIITANTTTAKWSEYKPIFYSTVRSFEFEY